MLTRDHRVLVALPQMVLQMAAALGVDRSGLLQEAGIAEAEIANRDDYVSLDKQIALGEALRRARPGVNIGLVGLEHFHISTLGVLGYVVRHCTTLGDALQAFARHQTLLSSAVQWTIERQGTVRIRIEATESLQRLGFPLETQVGIWLKLGQELTQTQWSATRVRLRHQPLGPAEELCERFGCPIQFNAPVNELELPEQVLDLPVVGARPELQPSLVKLVQTLEERQAAPQSMASRVGALLLEELPKGMTSKDEVARRLGVSVRTLTRRLSEEDVSFRDLLDQTRQKLAMAWLTDASIAIYEVAYLLGYSEPSTFHRSFRRWTGMTPSAWRSQRARA